MDFTKNSYDIIVLAGQSNAQGTGRGKVTEEYATDEDIISLSPVYYIGRIIDTDGVSKRQIIYEDTPFVFSIADERVVDGKKIGNLSLTFSKEYKKSGCLDSGRKILIIQAAIGATGFNHGHWGLNKPLYLKAIEMLDYALSLNPENKLKAVLWHQGEHDVNKEPNPNVYKSRLSEIFTDLKKRYNSSTLPIITADFSYEWKNAKGEKGYVLSKIIKDVVSYEGGIFINTDDLLSNNQESGDGDMVHFCRESLHLLGKRYFEAYKKLTN